MPRSKQNGRSGKRRVIPSKNALLPLPQARITEISLGYHLALAACGGVHGSSHLFNELTRAIYLTFYLGEMGYMPVALDLYRMAEAGLEAGIRRGNEKGSWQLDPSAVATLEVVLQVHDSQLARTRAGDLIKAEQRLTHFIMSGKTASPFD
ncbi:hypothetical protein [Paraburkholderia hospita]|uniref:hypothetical protein n=1 Tax=Paraburkholderia hospita TaxID=169430 RepID=UPI0010397617|nr:hypothetical protein [Paraburkholderia hospita]